MGSSKFYFFILNNFFTNRKFRGKGLKTMGRKEVRLGFKMIIISKYIEVLFRSIFSSNSLNWCWKWKDYSKGFCSAFYCFTHIYMNRFSIQKIKNTCIANIFLLSCINFCRLLWFQLNLFRIFLSLWLSLENRCSVCL